MTHCYIGILGAGATGLKKLWFLSLFCSALPDIDGVITRFAVWVLGLRLSGIWWVHRGFSHSLLFALIVGIAAAAFAKKVLTPDRPLWLLVAYFFAVTASHGLIDATTHGGQGVMFFAPFHDGRYLFLFAPVPALRLRQWFGRQGLITFGKELLWIWLPFTIFYVVFRMAKRRSTEYRRRRSRAEEM